MSEESLLRMAAAIRHRGPDGYGLALDPGAGFVSTRLAIVDLPGGWQPLESAPGGALLVYNGEIYNHVELRAELEARGERFETTSDTEVALRLLELEGRAALDRFNGQFALAWWQPSARRLTLARDRFGVRPLLFSRLDDGTIVFGSEAKAIFASGEVPARPDLLGLDDVFTLWGARPPRTGFDRVEQVGPGELIVFEHGDLVVRRTWWEPRYDHAPAPAADLGELLGDSVRLRLRADVPVGAYLSGGLDSSLVSALAQEEKQGQLRTFSVAFSDPDFDESEHQEAVARALGTEHHVIEIGSREIAETLPEVIRHAETPLVRTAPVPLYLLAREVRARGLTVVITGEGADELFWGYDLFKEVAIRELHRVDPDRAREMLSRLYPYLADEGGSRRGPAFTRFLLETGAGPDPLASHLTRAEATAAVRAFYRPEVSAQLDEDRSLERLRRRLPPGFEDWSALERAAWLELTTLLEPYLLAAQGDRVAMASGVEGRYPFLDHRVFEYSIALPPTEKLDGMRDKIALRELAAELLPAEVSGRPKQPYRAPEVAPFFAAGAPQWVDELLSPAGLAETGLWDEGRVAGLVRRCRAGRATGIREGMALVGILTTQLWHQQFLGATGPPEAEGAAPRVRIDRRESSSEEAE